MAFTYEARADAEAAARDAGLTPNDVVCRDHDSGMWGWKDAPVAKPEAAPASATGQARYVVELANLLSEQDAHAVIYQLAHKLGVPVTARTVDGLVSFTANPGDKPAKAGKVVVPDDVQRQIIDLCLRPEGSNPWELYEKVLPKQPRPWGKMVEKICNEFGYTVQIGVTRWGKKPTDSFKLHTAIAQAA